MQFILGVVVIFLAIFFILIFNLRSADFEALTVSLLNGHPKTLKGLAKGKKSGVIGYILQTQKMLAAIGQAKKAYTIFAVSLVLMFLGGIAAVALGNAFLLPVLALAFAIIPSIYVRFQYIKYNKLLIEELEIALSTISISYERSENILLSIEENLENIHAPLGQIFEAFVYRVKFVNPNLEAAIDDMKKKINHSVWVEWCDSLKRCVQNRNLKHILRPTVNKLTKIKLVTNDLQNILYDANLNFWILLIVNCILLFVGVYLVPAGLQADIPDTLVNVLIAANAALMLFAAIKVSLETKSIDFDI